MPRVHQPEVCDNHGTLPRTHFLGEQLLKAVSAFLEVAVVPQAMRETASDIQAHVRIDIEAGSLAQS